MRRCSGVVVGGDSSYIPRMRTAAAIALVVLFASAASSTTESRQPAAQSRIKALVGGTLIDGFGGRPVRNSVDPHRRRAHHRRRRRRARCAVPAGAEVISTEGMSVLPGLWDMHVHLMLNGHSDYAHWDKTYPPQLGPVIMPASARSSCCWPA